MFWFRFVDDTFAIQQQAHKQLFLDHINSIDPALKITLEGNRENGAFPFLDILVKPKADNLLSITVYQRPTHTDWYLQGDSHCNLSAKYSVIGTLTHGAKTVCTTTEHLYEELQHLREALVRCRYWRWPINKIQNKFTNNNWEEDGNNNTQVGNNTTQANNNSGDNREGGPPQRKTQHRTHSHPILSEPGGDDEECVCHVWDPNKFKGNKTFRQVLVKPKDMDPKEKKSGVVYSYQCGVINCGEEYIGEPPGPWGIATESISKHSPLYMCTNYTLVISSAQTNSI